MTSAYVPKNAARETLTPEAASLRDLNLNLLHGRAHGIARWSRVLGRALSEDEEAAVVTLADSLATERHKRETEDD